MNLIEILKRIDDSFSPLRRVILSKTSKSCSATVFNYIEKNVEQPVDIIIYQIGTIVESKLNNYKL